MYVVAVPSQLLQPGHQVLASFVIDVGDDDSCPFSGEAQRRLTTDAVGSTRDQGNLAFEAPTHGDMTAAKE